MNEELYIVICRGDVEPGFTRGAYELATRTVFATKEAAVKYAESIDSSRGALVVAGRWRGLRFDEERGTLAYWEKLS